MLLKEQIFIYIYIYFVIKYEIMYHYGNLWMIIHKYLV